MKLHGGLPLLVLVACSSSSGGTAPSGDSGAPPADTGIPTLDSGMTPDVEGADAADSAAMGDAASDGSAEAGPSYSWQAIPNAPKAPTMGKMDDIYFPSAMIGYAVSGPTSSIYKTSDGGTTWTSVFTHAGTYFRSLLFTDDNNGFASNLGAGLSPQITDTNVLYRTTDGGMTWTPVAASAISGPMPSGICNQTKVDAQHLVAVGRVEGPAYLMSSGDGGGTWTSVSLTTQLSMLIDARFKTPMDGIVIGSSPGNISTGNPPFYCTVLHTSDGGGTWAPVFTSKTKNSLCWKISFPSDQVGYVSVQDAGGSGPATFAKTTDGGQTWTESPLPKGAKSYYLGIGIGFVTEDEGWVSSDYDTSGPIAPTYHTTDGGQTWTQDATLQSPINRFRFLDATHGFAIGGTIWKMSAM
jgi:photosystem II stability/assembly factor-like uncharacterized protein